MPTGTAARVAVAAAATRARVELAGTVSDDGSGDSSVVALGRAGVGHAALLRIPGGGARPLEAADIELGLSYLTDCRVIVVAEPLAEDALRAALDGARYYDAHVIVLPLPGAAPPAALPETATVLEQPEEDAGAFTGLVGRYAALLDDGRAPADAWRDALADTGWEQSEA